MPSVTQWERGRMGDTSCIPGQLSQGSYPCNSDSKTSALFHILALNPLHTGQTTFPEARERAFLGPLDHMALSVLPRWSAFCPMNTRAGTGAGPLHFPLCAECPPPVPTVLLMSDSSSLRTRCVSPLQKDFPAYLGKEVLPCHLPGPGQH